MQDPEPQISIENLPERIDPRIYAFNRFEPNDPAKHGKLLATASTNAQLDNQKVTFAVPSHAALCLSIAHAAYVNLLEFPLLSFSRKATQITGDNLAVLYDYFENIFVNVVFSHTALEAFVNQSIPDNFVFTRLRQDKKCNESFNKDQVERNLSLDIKLSEVLPEITGIELKKETLLWQEYSKLKAIRDRIVHVKSADLGIKGNKVSSIWADLIAHRATDFSFTAHKLISHFPIKNDHSSSPVAAGRNMWIKHFPHIRPKLTSVMKTINDRTLLATHCMLLRENEVASIDLSLGATLFKLNFVLESSEDGVIKWDLSNEDQLVTLRVCNTRVGVAAASEKDIPIVKSNSGDIIHGQFAIQHFSGDLSSVTMQFTLSKHRQ